MARQVAEQSKELEASPLTKASKVAAKELRKVKALAAVARLQIPLGQITLVATPAIPPVAPAVAVSVLVPQGVARPAREVPATLERELTPRR
jgi:hypothetical protein